ncbi:hypothetical protein FRC08_005403 [Ceratobasidium sp. 394]|nr:hypothetical protein FRC08_005403 [Ceratobasidium sp. 394]
MPAQMSIGAVLSSIPSFVLTYGAIWLALYTARWLIVLLVSLPDTFLREVANNRSLVASAIVPGPYKSYLRYLPGPRRHACFGADWMFDLQNPRFSKQTHEKYEQVHGRTAQFQGMAYVSGLILCWMCFPDFCHRILTIV